MASAAVWFKVTLGGDSVVDSLLNVAPIACGRCIGPCFVMYSQTCKNDHSQKDQKLVFNTNYCLMQVKSIAECSMGSILQYFRPSLSYHLSLRSLFCLFLSGHFTQVLL